MKEAKPKIAGIRCRSNTKYIVHSPKYLLLLLYLLASYPGLVEVLDVLLSAKDADDGKIAGNKVAHVNPRANPSMIAKIKNPYINPPLRLLVCIADDEEVGEGGLEIVPRVDKVSSAGDVG